MAELETDEEESPRGEAMLETAADASLAELEERVKEVRDSWETDSLFEDVFDELSNETALPEAVGSAEVCSGPEASRLRRELRELGPAVFCQRTVDTGRYSAKKLLSAFGIRPPELLEGRPDEDYFSLLSLAISRELSKRAKLAGYNSPQDAVELIRGASNIVVITGAGISTSLGIPDFRSKETGLYARLEHLGLSDPQEVFDINLFREDPSIFYSIAKDIVPATDRYTPAHQFIAMLHQRGKLLTNYSQNIDNLEVKAGLPPAKLVQCHGSFGTASCLRCRHQVPGETILPEIRAGSVPRCPRCSSAPPPPRRRQLSSQSSSTKRKRPSASTDTKKRPRRWTDNNIFDDDDDDDDSSSDDDGGGGIMKPDITFFGEALPKEFSTRLTEHDRDKVDLVLVMGTSLKVTPVSEIVSWLPPHIPQVYISRQPVQHINFDIDLLGDCDLVVAELCRRLAWPLAHPMVPPHQRVEIRPEPGSRSRHFFVEARSEPGDG